MADVNEKVGISTIKQGGLKQADFAKSPFSTDEIYFHMIFPKSDPQAQKNREKFNALLLKSQKSGQFEKLNQQYIKQHLSD